jgi:hypothetical protein
MGSTVEAQLRHRLTRRFFIAAASGALTPELHSYARLGDAEWMRTFREFIDAFNDFVVGLDHNRLNLAAWERMRTTFHELEAHGRNVK